MTGLASVMRRGNYSTHQIGKWHAGAATPQHTPAGRGYDTSFGYITGAANDYWDQRVWGGRPMGFVDLWATDRPAWGQNTSCQGRCKPSSSPAARGGQTPSGGTDAAYSTGPEEVYEETMLRDRVLDIIREWSDGDGPLFINYDSHVAHSPLQAPGTTFTHFNFINNKTGNEGDYEKHRQLYASMVKYLDLGVGAIVKELKAKGMWANTLWVCQSDNGGPSFTGDNHTANNWPLKGGKMTNWVRELRCSLLFSSLLCSQCQHHRSCRKVGFALTRSFRAASSPQ
jgi:arylsulfatase I/J